MNAPIHTYVVSIGSARYRIQERTFLEAYHQFQKITRGKMTVQSHQIVQEDAAEGAYYRIF